MSLYSDDIRKKFREADAKRDEGLITPDDVQRYDDIIYGPDSEWNRLDIYRPRSAGHKPIPAIISVHGGGWVYGDKERYQFYCMNLAQRGFAVVNFTYRLAPEHKFPAPLEDTNSVFGFVLEHGAEYGIDINNLFAVGDSAGGHSLGLYAAALTNAELLRKFSFSVPKELHLNAIAINCGKVRLDPIDEQNEMTKKLMADYLPEHGGEELRCLISTINHITEDYPPVFIMTSSGDFLQGQACILAKRLTEKKVPFEFHYYGNNRELLPHVFHLNIRSEAASLCNDEECHFFSKYIKKNNQKVKLER